MFKTKILILGPCQSGKSTIANFLADAAEAATDIYRPTQGVRIVEFESNGLELHGRNIDAEVELWDCSGDRKFEQCWPAIQKDANGVILVCNTDAPQQVRELEQWYQNFVLRRGIKAAHVIIFFHQKPETAGSVDDVKLPQVLSGISRIVTNIEHDGEALRLEFNNFLCSVIAGLTEKRDQDELSIIT